MLATSRNRPKGNKAKNAKGKNERRKKVLNLLKYSIQFPWIFFFSLTSCLRDKANVGLQYMINWETLLMWSHTKHDGIYC